MSAPPPPRALRRIVELATQAPERPQQPALAVADRPDRIELYADTRRRSWPPTRRPRPRDQLRGRAPPRATAAAGLGLMPDVARLPEGPSSTLLARSRSPRGPPSQRSRPARHRLRCTDRRRFTSWPVPDERLNALSGPPKTHGTHAVPLIDVSAGSAPSSWSRGPHAGAGTRRRVVAEQLDWVDRTVLTACLPTVLPASGRVADDLRRRFDARDSSRTRPGDRGQRRRDPALRQHDTRAAWLAAGEGLSALWLLATRDGSPWCPSARSSRSTRRACASAAGPRGWPPLVLVRVGWQPISRSQLEPTPRRPLDVLCSWMNKSWVVACAAAEAIGMTAAAGAARSATALTDQPSATPPPGTSAHRPRRPGRRDCPWLSPGPALDTILDPTGRRHWVLVTVLVAGLGWAAASLPAVLGRRRGR